MLTVGCISQIRVGHMIPNPVVKVTAMKASKNSKERFRFLSVYIFSLFILFMPLVSIQLFDGNDYIPAMLSSQMNKLIKERVIQKGSSIKLEEYTLTEQMNRQLINNLMIL